MRMVAGVVMASVVAVGGLLFASAADAGTYIAPSTSTGSTAARGAATLDPPRYFRYDFRVKGVIIWNEANASSVRNGLGSPGQGFYVDYAENNGPSYTCDNGVKSRAWEHGYNGVTKVSGFVPVCNLVL